MTKSEKEKSLKWIKAWRAAEDVLEKERRISIIEADSKVFVKSMAGMVDAILKKVPYRDSSGLVEQQFYFMRGLL